jgi:hypothetical protein
MKLYTDLNSNVAPIVGLDQANTQVVDGTSASTQSTVINADAEDVVRIAAMADIYLAFGTNPTATNAHVLLPSGAVEYLRVKKGHKIAVLGGKANITRVD